MTTKPKGIPRESMLELRERGKSNAEIARELNCTAQNVYSRIGGLKPRRSPTVPDCEPAQVTGALNEADAT
jgi:hypothetical protein